MAEVPQLCTTCDIFLCHCLTDGDIMKIKPLFRSQPNEYYYAFLQNWQENDPWTWSHLYWFTRAWILNCGRKSGFFSSHLETIDEVDEDII